MAFTRQAKGGILGHWKCQPYPDGTEIKGACGLDQTLLERLIESTRSLLDFQGTADRHMA